MCMLKRLVSFVLLLMIVAMSLCPSDVGASTSLVQELRRGNSKKFFSSLGMDCKCCDGVNGECRSSWESSCSKLQCHPWKYSSP